MVEPFCCKDEVRLMSLAVVVGLVLESVKVVVVLSLTVPTRLKGLLGLVPR